MKHFDSGKQEYINSEDELLAKFTSGSGAMCMTISTWYKKDEGFVNVESSMGGQSVSIEASLPSKREGWHKWDLAK